MKTTPEELADLMERVRAYGVQEGHKETSQRVHESTRELIEENTKLKEALRTWEVRTSTQISTATQNAAFPAVHAERKRIAKGIRDYFHAKKERHSAEGLLFGLALGDL